MFYTINLSPITRNQERFYDDNYFEPLPIVSTAFNVKEWKSRSSRQFRPFQSEKSLYHSFLVKLEQTSL